MADTEEDATKDWATTALAMAAPPEAIEAAGAEREPITVPGPPPHTTT